MIKILHRRKCFLPLKRADEAYRHDVKYIDMETGDEARISIFDRKMIDMEDKELAITLEDYIVKK